MKKPKLVIGFSRYRNKELLTKAQFIVDSMLGKKEFAAFADDVEALKKLTESYAHTLSKAESRSINDVAAMNETRLGLEGLLKQLGLRVEATFGGDEVQLVNSGFNLAKDRAPIGILAKPANFKAQVLAKGMVELRFDAVHGADSYQYEYRQVGATNWIVLIRSKSNMLLNDLTSGAEYEFKVAAIGTAEERVYSDTISSFIL